MSEDGWASRRVLLSGACTTLAGGAVLLAGCGRGGQTGQSSVHRSRPVVQEADVELLSALLDLERHTVAAYTAGIPLLNRGEAKTAQQFLDEELQHTGELISRIKAAGGMAPQRTAGYDLGHPVDGTAVLTLLHALERAQIVAYLNAIPRLSPGPVRAAAASIVANDAQHIAVLRLIQGLPATPSAFLSGGE